MANDYKRLIKARIKIKKLRSTISILKNQLSEKQRELKEAKKCQD